jgi:DNA-binding MarR family transcriptional regulator
MNGRGLPLPRANHRVLSMKVPPPLEHWTGFALLAAADAAQHRYEPVLRKWGLSPQEFMVLSVVAAREGMTGGWIAERLGVSRQRVSQILCRLDRIGFVGRAIRLNDFRSKDIWLSADGKKHYADMCAAIDRADAALHEELSPEMRAALRRFLLHIVPGERSYIRWNARHDPPGAR